MLLIQSIWTGMRLIRLWIDSVIRGRKPALSRLFCLRKKAPS
jgi:hypothetical protein